MGNTVRGKMILGPENRCLLRYFVTNTEKTPLIRITFLELASDVKRLPSLLVVVSFKIPTVAISTELESVSNQIPLYLTGLRENVRHAERKVDFKKILPSFCQFFQTATYTLRCQYYWIHSL